MIARVITIGAIFLTAAAGAVTAQGGQRGPATPGLTHTTSAFADGSVLVGRFHR